MRRMNTVVAFDERGAAVRRVKTYLSTLLHVREG